MKLKKGKNKMLGRILEILVLITILGSSISFCIGVPVFLYSLFSKNSDKIEHSLLFFIPMFLVLILSPIIFLGEKNK